MIFAFLLCCIPTAVNLIHHRKGREKKKKVLDKVVLSIISLALAFVVKWVFGYDLLRSLALMLGIYILVFDYAIVWLLRKNDVISPTANIWTYTGKSTYWYDQMVSKVPPWLRFVVRVIVFGGSVYFFKHF